jgi:hypothetical protein
MCKNAGSTLNKGATMFRLVLLSMVATALASCNQQVGMPQAWQGIGLPKTEVTNPQGGGPQVVRFGPPDTSSGRGR